MGGSVKGTKGGREDGSKVVVVGLEAGCEEVGEDVAESEGEGVMQS